MDKLTPQQIVAIEDLKETILEIAWNNNDFICSECINTIHKLLGILTMLTDDENTEFAQEIYSIIGE